MKMLDGSRIRRALSRPLYFLTRSYNPALFEFPCIKHFYLNRLSLPELVHAVLVNFRIMPKVAYSKQFLNGL